MIAFRVSVKLSHEASAKISEKFAQKKSFAQATKVREERLPKACNRAVAFCKRVVAEQNKTTGRYRLVLWCVRQPEKAQKNGEVDESDANDKLHKLYEEDWCGFVLAFATRASESERRMLKLELELFTKERNLHDAEVMAQKVVPLRSSCKELCAESALLKTDSQVARVLKAEVQYWKEKITKWQRTLSGLRNIALSCKICRL